jgi:putative phage-type endonuclease
MTTLAPVQRAIDAHAESIPVSEDKDRHAWLEARRLGLGASDAGTVLGVNPWSGPFELWLEKTGQIPPKDLSDVDAIYWGKTLEDVVRKEIARRRGTDVWKPDVMYRSIENPWQQASLDGLTWDADGPLIVECKTANHWVAHEWDDDATPPSYEAQVGHAAAVTGIRRAVIGVLIGGVDFQMRTIDIDDDFVQDLTDIEAHWWEHHVINGYAPDPDASDSCTDLLKRRWSDVLDATAILDPAAVDVADAYLALNEELAALDKRKTEYANWFRNALGPNEYGGRDGRTIVTNKKYVNPKTDWPAVAKDAAYALGVPLTDLTARHTTLVERRMLLVPKKKKK